MASYQSSVIATSIGFILLGALYIFSIFSSSNKIMAHYWGKPISVVVSEFNYTSNQNRARGSGPTLYVYLTESDNLYLRLVSLDKLNLGQLVNCQKYNDFCYDIEDKNVLSYIPTVKFFQVISGVLSMVLGILIFIFRGQILLRIKKVEQAT